MVPIGSPTTSCNVEAWNLTSVPSDNLSLCVYSSASLFWPLVRYFRKGGYFGLACFANMPVESELERGARMKSVGILSPSYTLLYRYMHFLENQVRWDMLCVCVCVFLILSPAHHLIYVLFTLFISHTTVFTAFISCAYLQSLLPFCYKKPLSHLLNMNSVLVPVTAIVTGAHLHAVFVWNRSIEVEVALTASLFSSVALLLQSSHKKSLSTHWLCINIRHSHSCLRLLPNTSGNEFIRRECGYCGFFAVTVQ